MEQAVSCSVQPEGKEQIENDFSYLEYQEA